LIPYPLQLQQEKRNRMVYREPPYTRAKERLQPADSRLIAIFVLSWILFVTGGCATIMPVQTDRPVVCAPLEIFIQAPSSVFQHAKVAVLPFDAPDYAPGVGNQVAETFAREFLRRGVFSQAMAIPFYAKSDEEAIGLGRREGFDLVVRSSILYLLDGSGAQPTHLETSIRILDVRSGKTLWYLKQKAFSEPGPDVDLFWTTFSGSPAQRYDILAKALAEQLSMYLLSPMRPDMG
jgi:hypothetical protein